MPVYADCEVVVVAEEVAGAGAGMVLVLVVPVDDLQSAAQLLDVSGPSHVPSPQHCFVCPTAHAVAVIPPPPAGLPPPLAGVPPPPLVDVPVFEVGVTPAGGARRNLSAMGIVRGAHMSKAATRAMIDERESHRRRSRGRRASSRRG